MISYKVKMINNLGKTVSEVIPADNEMALFAIVKERGNYLVDFEEVSQTSHSRMKLKLNSLVVFSYQLSAMLSAGINVIDALRMIQSRIGNEKERRIYRSLYEEVQKGNSLSVAMMEQQGAFDDMMISMVKSGESSGSLDEVLQTMSNQYERDKKIKQKMRTASVYPLVLFVVSIIVVLILVAFVLPGIMASFPVEETPFLTKILIGMSNFILDKWYILLIAVAGLAALVFLIMNTPSSRLVVDRLLLKIPVVGKLLRTVYSARCARSFASLYSHGVNALEMIELTSRVMGNTYLESEFEKVYVSVSRGELISNSIDEIEEFDPMLAAMINVGEETGDLEGILKRTADYFDLEAEAALTSLVGLVEPVMIVWMGIIIGLIVVSILQPMFTMYSNIE